MTSSLSDLFLSVISKGSSFETFLLGKNFINDYYGSGNEIVIDSNKISSTETQLSEIEKKITKILETKIRPAVARDGGDIKFKKYNNGIVTVQLQGSCSGCPSSIMTLKQGVQNLLCHYIPEIKEVITI